MTFWEDVLLVLELVCRIMAWGYFMHGLWWRSTHSVATAAVLLLFAAQAGGFEVTWHFPKVKRRA